MAYIFFIKVAFQKHFTKIKSSFTKIKFSLRNLQNLILPFELKNCIQEFPTKLYKVFCKIIFVKQLCKARSVSNLSANVRLLSFMIQTLKTIYLFIFAHIC